MKAQLQLFLEKMKREGLAPVVRETFAHYYGKVAGGAQGLIPECDIAAVN